MKDKGNALIFPGVISSHAELGSAEGAFIQKDGKKVMFKMKHKTFKPAGSSIVAYRPFFTVDKIEADEGKGYTLVTLTPFTDKISADLAEYNSKIGGAVAAATAVADAAKDAAGDKPAEDDKPAEGDGDKPAEGGGE